MDRGIWSLVIGNVLFVTELFYLSLERVKQVFALGKVVDLKGFRQILKLLL